MVLASARSPSSLPAGPPLNPGVLSTSGQYWAHASPCWALGDTEGPFQGGSASPCSHGSVADFCRPQAVLASGTSHVICPDTLLS